MLLAPITCVCLINLMSSGSIAAVSTLQQLLSERGRTSQYYDGARTNVSPRIVAPLKDAVTSDALTTLTLSPMSPLFALPSQQTVVSFVVKNRDSRPKTFLASVSEDAFSDPSHSRLPSSSRFVTALTETRLVLGSDASRNLGVLLRIPDATPLGTLRLITIRVQSTTDEVVKRFFFRVGEEERDEEKPICVVTEDDRQSSCASIISPEDCNSNEDPKWTARFRVRDTLSGLRSLSFSPTVSNSSLFSSDNFVIGSLSVANVYFFGSCCQVSQATVVASDMVGNEVECRAGTELVADPIISENNNKNDGEDTGNNVATATVAVVVMLLLMVVVVGLIVALLVTRRRRRAELAEMRASPQER